ncbi:MAG: hypothetical protein ACR2RE_24030 [Geminicoccaceae bacterium]
MKTNPRTYLETVPDDEPVFVVRAQDQLFQTVCRAWLLHARGRGVREEKIDGVKRILVEGAEWQEANPDLVKVPD